jgi:hypothetical protein
MRRFERLGNLTRNRQRLVQRQSALPDPFGQRWALHELHHEELPPVSPSPGTVELDQVPQRVPDLRDLASI